MIFGNSLRNVEYVGKVKPSAWRKIAMGLWAAPNDPSVYAKMSIDARPLLEKIELAKAAGQTATVNAMVVEAAAKALAEQPQANVVMRLGQLHQRKDINVFVHLLPSLDEDDLTGFVVRNADQKTVHEISQEIAKECKDVRVDGKDRMEATKDQLGGIPGIVLYPLFKLISFVMYSLNLCIPGLGLEKDAFGSISISSVGNLTNFEGFSPLDSYARCPIVIVLSAIRDEVKVIDGEIKACPILPLGLTFDHRYLDGVGLARFTEALNRHLSALPKPQDQASGLDTLLASYLGVSPL